MANYSITGPGNQDLIKRLMALKAQAQLTGQVNPNIAGVVQGSLEDQRNRAYQDAMLGISEKAQALKEKSQTAQENQFAQLLAQKGQQFTDTLGFTKQTTNDQIAAANQARTMGYINTGLGAALGAGYLYYDPYNLRRNRRV
jgi:hypothetical protein